MAFGLNQYAGLQAHRAVIRLAPDALVFINRKLHLPVCRRCKRLSDFQTDISSISYSVGTETIPGSASITIEAPRYSMRNYLENGKCVFYAMQEVEIWEKGRFLMNDEPQYYPVFWGLISSVEVSDGVPSRTISISCDGVLKWWQLTMVNMNPSLVDQSWAGQDYIKATVRSSIFEDLNPYQIMFYLAFISMGNLVGPQELVGYATGINQIADNRKAILSVQQQSVWLEQTEQITKYWYHRFANIGRSLRMFGLMGIKAFDLTKLAGKSAGQTLDNLSGNQIWNGLIPDFKMNEELIGQFAPYAMVGNGPDAFKSEMMSKADIAIALADAIGYEFYMDTTGEIMFKPPFYNLDVKNNEPFSVIHDEDIFSVGQTEEAPIATRVDVYGSMHNIVGGADSQGLVYGWDINYEMVRKYGYKPAPPKQINYARNSLACYLYAKAELSRINAISKRINLDIISRPELRVGFPVYIESLDKYGYVTTKSTNFSFGDLPRTTLGLTAIRGKYVANDKQMTGSEDDSLDGYPNRFGKIKGAPWRAQVFTGSSSKIIVNPATAAVIVGGLAAAAVPAISLIQSIDTEKSEINESLDYNFSKAAMKLMPTGTYEGKWEEQEVKPGNNLFKILTEGDGLSLKAFLVSDGDGYELIGGFRYGRGTNLSDAGIMNLNAMNELEANAGVKNVDVREDQRRKYDNIENASKNTLMKFNGSNDGVSRQVLEGLDSDIQSDATTQAINEFCHCSDFQVSEMAVEQQTKALRDRKTEVTTPNKFGGSDNAINRGK